MAVNRWKSSERKSWDLRKELMELLCLPLLRPTVTLRALAIVNDRFLSMLWNDSYSDASSFGLGSNMFQDATVFLFNNLLLKRTLSVVVTNHFVPYTLINYFLAASCSCAKHSVLSGRKCQSFRVDPARWCELLRILSPLCSRLTW